MEQKRRSRGSGEGRRGRLLDRLTAREAEVPALVGRGLSNAEIAARLFPAGPP